MKRQHLISLLVLLSIQTFVSARTLYVPSRDYLTIQSAINAAVNGDEVVVAPGVYTGPGNVDLNFGGKAITVKSQINPANPNLAIIASTIIDCGGDRYTPHRAFYFRNGEGANSKVLGFTIRNGYARGPKGADGAPGYNGYPVSLFVPIPSGDDPLESPPYALNGANASGSGYGGAILCAGASPTIQHCVISNCTVTGAQGGDGANGLSGTWDHWTISDFNAITGVLNPDAEITEDNPDGQWGGSGGAGSGNGYGGGIACLAGSSPTIRDCNISDNFARGGCGGDGGAGGNAVSSPPNASPPNYNGGNESFGGNAGYSIGDGRGGAIYCDSASNPTITNCIFSNNIATTGARAVGGLAGQGNTIPEDEGGPATDGADSLVFSTGGIAGGAAYYRRPSNANFIKCTFTGNKAYEAYVFYDPMFILGEDISAYTVGGALYSDTSNVVTLNTCDFINNMGGAVYCGPSCTVSINNTYDPNHKCLFTANSDPNDGSDLWVDIGIDFGSGGAIYLGPSSSANIQNCIFGANSAKNDGGALKCKSNITLKNCSFGDNTAESGYGGAIDVYLTATSLTIDANNCSFSGNRSLYGGGFSSENFTATFTNCYFVGNAAEESGGLDLVNGNVSISGGIIKDNIATDGYGGGLSCSYTAAQILHCTIADNIANGSYPTGGCGGAINFEGWSFAHRVFNCLITGNSAAVDGGAIFCSDASPEVGNCTFSGNSAGGYGGAIFSDWSSSPQITDCIFENCNNHAIHEEDYGGNATVRYSLFYGNPNGEYYDSGTHLVYGPGQVGSIPGGVANLYGNPLFVAGPLGNYYLSQIAAGQGSNSPAINNGSDTAANLGLDTFMTRTDNVGDAGQVDRGYHYRDITTVAQYQLSASVVGGHGSIAPTSGTYYAGTVVTLTATPDIGWRVKAWSGTDNDNSTATTNTIIMNSDRTVTVEFEQLRTLIVAVGGGQQGYYSTIQDAVSDAKDSDTIVVYPGIYYGGYLGVSIYVDKSITIRSIYPDDPCFVAATIIDGYIGYQFNEGYNNTGVRFGPNADANTILNGFTIQNCGGYAGDSLNGNRNQGHPNGYDGGSIEGPAIFIEPGASPTVKNCVIRDNLVIGGNAGNGVSATDNENAGRGGWGGWAHGGAVYCAPDSSPKFINCQIIDNYAQGGDGGDGGNQPGATDGMPNYGGNWSMRGSPGYPVMDIDPFSRTVTYVTDGHLWEVWQWDEAFSYWPMYGDANRTSYFGDYRWYSGYGGGVYCDIGSNVTFTDCQISRNRAQGGVSGQGGEFFSGRPIEPLIPYEIPSFGGGVYCAADSTITFTGCTITDNIASEPNENNSHIDPYLGHGGGVCAEDTATVIFTNCTFSRNDADAGGGLLFADANAVISDCNFTFNSAFQGGGLFGEHGPAIILRSNFSNNIAFPDANDPNVVILGNGGGLHFWATDANIIDCSITSNQAEASGGGVFFGGESTSSLTNCLLTNNAAGRDGGGVSANIFSQLTISNCTIADNTVTGVGFLNTFGGGLYVSHESDINVIDSIIWSNFAIKGPQVAVGTGFEYDPRPSTVDVSYSDVQGGQPYVFIDEDCTLCTLNWGAGNIQTDPLFVAGYYLSQIAAGQLFDSPSVNTGSALASVLGLDSYTTRTDSVPDAGIVDMGYHYRPFTVPQYKLTINAIGVNVIEPNIYDPNYDGFYNWYTTVTLKIGTYDANNYQVQWTGTDDDSISGPNNTVTLDGNKVVTVRLVKTRYNLTIRVDGGNGRLSAEWAEDSSSYTIEDPCICSVKFGTVVQLTAEPNEDYRVGRWSGTDNDASVAKTNTVTMYDDVTVYVEFELPVTITVPGDYSSIQQALDASEEGDTVLVAPGTYRTSTGYLIYNRAVTISSVAPDDPCVVAATVIEMEIGGEGYVNTSAFTIYNVGPEMVLNGITISGFVHQAYSGLPGDQLGEDGYNGDHAFGGGIVCIMASPTIKNCIITDCSVIGGNGGDGYNGSGSDPNDPNIHGTDGGWPGRAYGGGLACLVNSNPAVVNCTFQNCSAIGGNGGDGGNGNTNIAAYGNGGRGGGWYYGVDSRWYNMPWDNSSQGYARTGPVLNSFYDFYTEYTGRGGAVLVGEQCSPTFIHCTFTNNRTEGGTCGITGLDGWPPVDRVEPSINWEIDNFGGAVYCETNSSPIFTDCNFTGNTADTNYPSNNDDPYVSYGGAVAWETNVNIAFEDCTFSENLAAIGGAMYWSDADVEIVDCNISGNLAYQGGGLFGTSGSAIIGNCIIQSNFAGAALNNVGGQGGGIYSASMAAEIFDCNISDNDASVSGGGMFFTGVAGSPIVTNCLITSNFAGRDGGGISANWQSDVNIANCTIADNVVTGIGFGAGYGGGLYCSYGNYTNIINSILWGNSGQRGPQLAIGTGFEYDRRPSTVDVSYSDVQGGQVYVFIDKDCTLNWGAGNIHANPLFVIGPLGSYYLSQIETGDPNQTVDSPCINAGSDMASSLGMHQYTTRTDKIPDRGIVDMGYHYPFTAEAEPCRFCELFRDGIINFMDFAIFALNWLSEDCNPANDWCQHSDVTLDTYVDFEDVQLFAKCWLVEDTSPPVPNPSEWKIEPYPSSLTAPYTISMIAKTADDAWDFWVGHVQYYFECVYGNCNDSDWQEDPNYTDSNLAIGVEYGYKVRARDTRPVIPDDGTGEWGNKTEWSVISYAIAGEEPPPPEDHNPPIPNPMTWATEPYATSPTSIAMAATIATDDTAGVEYYFEDFDFPGVNSGWIGVPTWTNVNLIPNTTYTYRVMARDTSFWQNQTGWSELRSATTPAETPPNYPPAPVAWALTTPTPPYETGSGDNAYAHMTVQVAIDPEGSGVQYYFECVDVPGIFSGICGAEAVGYSSGWINVPQWDVCIGRALQGFHFRFKVRDTSPAQVESGWSTSRPCLPP